MVVVAKGLARGAAEQAIEFLSAESSSLQQGLRLDFRHIGFQKGRLWEVEPKRLGRIAVVIDGSQDSPPRLPESLREAPSPREQVDTPRAISLAPSHLDHASLPIRPRPAHTSHAGYRLSLLYRNSSQMYRGLNNLGGKGLYRPGTYLQKGRPLA